ncbi:FixH family protein [Salipiger aestuarii]|uniref:Nitrogen fixation protein FixH n=1 Tax=Salipiger aestuarii TaxID=568098 RepID=A0A327YDC5_9RHOB|nr:FixH family protein [Salipiger aestuarii]KAA8613068.1 nitrogen fixation protein FixH [Salipiger aestuarii]KAB2542538.1 nitrogen fixation protein FixH [Salipiger aestuarii]RAK19013.1 nitrogen fixation protein FixH [Salipiger aestuarii]
MTRDFRLNGWHVLAIFVGAFAVIIGVNLALAWNAVATFPGLEVANSYVASQTFDDRRAAQEALGWTVDAQAIDGQIVLAITDAKGYPVQPRTLSAKVGRTTSSRDDRTPDFTFDGRAYTADDPLATGYWNVWLTAEAFDGTAFQQRLSLRVR